MTVKEKWLDLGKLTGTAISVIALVTFFLSATGLLGLATQVEENTRAIHQGAVTDTIILHNIKNLKCLLLLPDTIKPLQAVELCD